MGVEGARETIKTEAGNLGAKILGHRGKNKEHRAPKEPGPSSSAGQAMGMVRVSSEMMGFLYSPTMPLPLFRVFLYSRTMALALNRVFLYSPTMPLPLPLPLPLPTLVKEPLPTPNRTHVLSG